MGQIDIDPTGIHLLPRAIQGQRQATLVSGLWRRFALVWLAIVALMFAPTALRAQTSVGPVGQATVDRAPTIDRNRLDRQDPALPQQAPSVAVPRARVAIDGANAIGSTLARVRFEGSTLPPTILARAASPFAGAPLTRDTLQKLADAVSKTYAASDIAFYAVSIPAQTLAGGVLVVRVVEGRVVSYTLARQTRSTPNRLIDAQLQPLLHDAPAHKATLERTISLLRDIPGQTVKADLRRTTKPDELALALDVERKQVEVTLNINNRGVVNVVSGVQAQIGVALNGVVREGDSTRLSAYVPFQPSRYQFYSASHTTPIGAAGTTVSVSGAYVRTRTREPEVRGEAKQFGLVVAHPLIRSYNRNLSLTASLDGTNSDNYFLDTAFGGFRTRTLRLGANWSAVDKKNAYGVSASLSQGIDGLGAHPTLGYSEAGYRKANLQIVALKQLNKKITVKAGLRGQYSGDRLPTAERFALGGESAGLAYRYGVLTADKAVAADVEAAWIFAGDPSTRGAAAFVYADGVTAHSYARPAFGLSGANFSLASAGGGVRVTPRKGWAASAQIAVPVHAPSREFSRKARVFFSVTRTV